MNLWKSNYKGYREKTIEQNCLILTRRSAVMTSSLPILLRVTLRVRSAGNTKQNSTQYTSCKSICQTCAKHKLGLKASVQTSG